MLHDAMQAKGAASKLIIVPGGGHGRGMHVPEYLDEMISFFQTEYEKKICR